MPIPALTTPAVVTKFETLKRWSDTEAGRHETLGSWTTSRLPDGTLLLSARVKGPNPGRALHQFADRQASYLANRSHTPGDQLPVLDVSQGDREAVLWRTDGVWVELWHPTPATAPVDRPEPRSAASVRPPRRGLPGARLPFGRRSKANTP